MFVRWKTREHWRSQYQCHYDKNTGETYCSGKTKKYTGKSFSAALVRSERVDGKPRQRIVAYLGHIKEKFLGAPAHRLYFWKKIDYRLDALALGPTERQRIEEQVGKVLARPTPEEAEQVKRERAALWAMLKRL